MTVDPPLTPPVPQPPRENSISYQRAIGRAISAIESHCEEHDIPPCASCTADSQALRELARLVEEAERLKQVYGAIPGVGREAHSICTRLAAGFSSTPPGAGKQ